MVYMDFNNGTVLMTRAKNYKGNYEYAVIYGLQISTHRTDIVSAIKDFNDCVNHALNCEGVEI